MRSLGLSFSEQPLSAPSFFPESLTLSLLRKDQTAQASDLFARARLAEDELLIPGYISHAIRENYFEKALAKYHAGAYGVARAFAATRGTCLVGFCMAGATDLYEELGSFTKEAPCGELHWLYVEPSLKRHGIGSLLFRQAVQTLQEMGYRRMVVNLLQKKPATRAFYEAMGLHLLAERIERNTRSGVTFTVPCYLMGSENLKGQAYGL